MKLATKLMLLISLMATVAVAQTIPAGTFKHIIILVMENRTPDNLFGSNPAIHTCGSEDQFEQGVDIDNGGHIKGQQQPICNISLTLATNQDPPRATLRQRTN
jgi:phospholipase C